MKKCLFLVFLLFGTLCLSLTKLNVFAEVMYISSITPTLQNIELECEFGQTITIELSSYITSAIDEVYYTDVDWNADHFRDKSGTLLYTKSGNLDFYDDIISLHDEHKIILNPNPIFINGLSMYYTARYEGQPDAKAYIYITFIDSTGPELVENEEDAQNSLAIRRFVLGTHTYSDFKPNSYFTAIDQADGIISEYSDMKIYKLVNDVYELSDGIDFTSTGDYKVVLTYTDSSLNSESGEVFISVGTGYKPVITMKTNDLTIQSGNAFNIYDYIEKITDFEDGTIDDLFINLPNLIVINNITNTSKAGKFNIVLKYTDSDTNTTEETFTLTIEGTTNVWFIVLLVVLGLILTGGVVVVIVFLIRRRTMRV